MKRVFTVAGQRRVLTDFPAERRHNCTAVRGARQTATGQFPGRLPLARAGGTLPPVTRLISVADLEAPAPTDARSLRPPPRFAEVAFETYHPQHPSQTAARDSVHEFVLSRQWRHRVGAAKAAATAGRRAQAGPGRGQGQRRRPAWWPFAGNERQAGAGLYLDGGFGVGKTHLLASAYAAADTSEKRYLSFQELVYLIGVMGMERAKAELATAELMCVDEFELDDPGNTLIVKTFLAALLGNGGAVVTTSNTPPEAQGQGRFNADDFQREIQSLAANFKVIRVDGPDYRHRSSLGEWLDPEHLEHLKRTEPSPAPRLALEWDELFELLRGIHPTRVGGILKQVGSIYLAGASKIGSLNDALRFVHFVDKAYDLEVAVRVSGEGPLVEVFDASYRDGAYAKKHYRCLSRLSEMLAEAAPEGEPVA